MLIVEGTDLIGKTTLCRSLVSRLEAVGYPHTYSHLGLLPKGWDYHWDYVARMVDRVVQDRFYLSEWAYGLPARGVSRLDARALDLLDAELRVRAGFTVLLLADESVLNALYAARQQPELFELATIKAANARFEQLASRAQHVRVMTRTDGWPTDSEVDAIVDEYVAWQDFVRTTWRRDTRRS